MKMMFKFFGGVALIALAACAPGTPMQMSGGGGGSGPNGIHSGQTAQQVATDLGMDPSKVHTIDSTAVGATGSGQSVGDTVSGEGLTQGDLGPNAGAGNPPMNDSSNDSNNSSSDPSDPPMF